MEIRSERRYVFPVAPQDLWDAISRLDAYRVWWPWLHRFDARTLAGGDVWSCEVRPPVPYALAFTITLDEVIAPRRIRATIAGDVVGHATVSIDAHDGGCDARFVSTLAPGNGFLRAVASVARPVAQFGHDWVLDVGSRQFAERALAPGTT